MIADHIVKYGGKWYKVGEQINAPSVATNEPQKIEETPVKEEAPKKARKKN